MELTNIKNQNKRLRPVVDVIYGKVPPQAKDLEESVLGQIMQEGCYQRTAETLKPEMFYVDAHKKIYKAIQTLFNQGQPTDTLSVKEQLLKTEELDLVGGPYYLTTLTGKVVNSTKIEFYAWHIKQKFIKREIIRICMEIQSDAYEDFTDPEDLVIRMGSELRKLEAHESNSGIRSIVDVLVDVFKDIEENSLREESLTGIPSGFRELDKITNGWQDTDLIILAARPSKGKTAFALSLAKNAAKKLKNYNRKNKGVGILSIEMKDKQNGQRMLASEAKMFLGSIRSGRLDEEQKRHLYQSGVQQLAQLPIFISDKARPALHSVRTTIRKMVDMGCGLILIDYLQLINGVEGEENVQNREREIANISSNLKALAKELNVPIIALSQLSREIEKRSDGEPQLSDLRESGALEQDADLVIFLYGPSKKEIEEDLEKEKNLLVKIAKHRNGQLETLEFEFDKGYQSIEEKGVHKKINQTNWRPVNDFGFPDKDPF